MEKFDINKEMAKLKGLNIIEKCSALDDLLDDLEDAQEQIICAKDEISEEYANVFKKKFHEEIASFIAETFDGKIPYVEKYGYQIMYDNRPIYITLYCTYGECSICLFVKSGSTKHLTKLAGVLGVNITGNGASLNLEVTEKDLISKVKQIMLLSDSYEKWIFHQVRFLFHKSNI